MSRRAMYLHGGALLFVAVLISFGVPLVAGLGFAYLAGLLLWALGPPRDYAQANDVQASWIFPQGSTVGDEGDLE